MSNTDAVKLVHNTDNLIFINGGYLFLEHGAVPNFYMVDITENNRLFLTRKINFIFKSVGEKYSALRVKAHFIGGGDKIH